MRRFWISIVIATAACGHAPPKPTPPPELGAATAADLQGEWVTSDDLDWSYRMTIAADSTMTLDVDRAKMGHCQERGKLVPSGDHEFKITYDQNTCKPQYDGTPVEFEVKSFTGKVLDVELTGTAIAEHRRYTRAPVQQPLAR